MNFNTGILYPKRSLLGLLKHFKLAVEVTDGKFTDIAVVDVNVLDVNQNKPLFKEPSSANASVLIPEVRRLFINFYFDSCESDCAKAVVRISGFDERIRFWPVISKL